MWAESGSSLSGADALSLPLGRLGLGMVRCDFSYFRSAYTFTSDLLCLTLDWNSSPEGSL